MDSIANVAAVLAVVALGLSAGAVVAEGAVLVPFWRSLPPAAFLAWYRDHGDRLLKFFGPLEVAAAGLTLVALALCWFHGAARFGALAVSALLALAVLAAFPMYFQKVNASFATGTIAADDVPEALRRWACWHWARTAIALGAFLSAISGLP